ncbi:GTPase [Candidatus Nasuia deltocephalinicola]|uniref:GTPase n=1 Tax=Candidatus Nasuia deltocephalincola TaxID=1160784 RepID=UPI00216AE709|nr:GTPase [Candidatus Nasuia deltocephalinicola]
MFYKFLNFIKLDLHPGRGGNGQKIFFKKNKILKKNFGRGGNGGNIYFFFDKILKNDFYYYLNNNKFYSENGKNSYKLFKNGKDGKNILLRIPYKCKIFNIKDNNFLNFKNKKIINLTTRGGLGGRSYLLRDSENRRSWRGAAGCVKSYFLLNNFYFNFCLIGLTNSGKSSFISNFLKNILKVSNYCYTTLEKKFFYIKLYKSKKFSILDNPGFLKNYYHNILEFKISQKLSKIFFHFLNFFFIFDIIFNFKLYNNKIYIYNKSIFYKPRFLIFNKIDLISKFKNIIIFKLKYFLNWYNFIFFNSFNYKNFYIFKKFI